ncbi:MULTISPECIES: NmrA/HSCARG family protein [unclassified Devosia]|uniref:NmrA/HSCARG family protein n=1 Tax=unclassified Devosia TaxID=196773 RepID=UPI00086BDA96|nr:MULTISPECIES: NmrA/HSCARG family protein [unclassified Devosia]MBN9362058.1 NmrA/HSCARG family protein [Devosia sp.]ODS81213.1 MAG: nucleoside-diphosphate sugar epimerase [Devosia sp. SCN 66-27]OJX24670.1 MAG: nucleoside-diphosphate sugar epimerase [Devosia sp. 66-14]
MTASKTILVTGATGQQGGSVARALLGKGHVVRALTRNPGTEAASHLAAAGAEIVAGDFSDPASVERAARGADAMFVVTSFWGNGLEVETAQGIAAVQAAKAAGVGHLVFSSVADANKATGIPHFESKYRVEQAIADLGIPHTIVAPVAFMENVVAPWGIEALRNGVYAFGLPAQRSNQLIAVADIGAFVAAVIERGASVFGQRFDIAGDQLSGTDQAAILARATGRPVHYQEIPLAAARQQDPESAIMFEWFDRVGYDVDIASLHRAFPEVRWHAFDAWARDFDWSVLAPPSQAANG